MYMASRTVHNESKGLKVLIRIRLMHAMPLKGAQMFRAQGLGIQAVHAVPDASHSKASSSRP